MKQLSFFLLFLTACSPQTAPAASVFTGHFPVETETATYDFVWPFLSEEIEAPNVEEALSMEAVLDTTEAELEQDLKEFDRGYTSSTYEVNYDKNGLLSLTLWVEFTGAYLDYQRYDFNFDLEEDRELTSDDLILPEKRGELVTLLDEKLQVQIQEKAEEANENPVEVEHRFTESDLENFILLEDGMEWEHDFGLPHMSEAGEPDGRVKMSYKELEGFMTNREIW